MDFDKHILQNYQFSQSLRGTHLNLNYTDPSGTNKKQTTVPLSTMMKTNSLAVTSFRVETIRQGEFPEIN